MHFTLSNPREYNFSWHDPGAAGGYSGTSPIGGSIVVGGKEEGSSSVP